MLRKVAQRLTGVPPLPDLRQLGEEITASALEGLAASQAPALASLVSTGHALVGQLALQTVPMLVDEIRLVNKSVHVPAERDESAGSIARNRIRQCLGLPPVGTGPSRDELLEELAFIYRNASALAPVFRELIARRVLYCGQAYYNAWYLSRALRTLGWRADVLNWDGNPNGQMHYHGEDFRYVGSTEPELTAYLNFYIGSLFRYDVFHFSNAHALSFGGHLAQLVGQAIGQNAEILLLKLLGKKIVYSNNGCLDGVSQTMFSRWGPRSLCNDCPWQDVPSVCSDERNLAWGAYRNAMADYQINIGSNRADYNADRRVHEGPGFYCLDPDIWSPELVIPDQYRIEKPAGRIILYHAMGNRELRTSKQGRNIKSTHYWHPIVEDLRSEGFDIQLLEPDGVPNLDVRYLQAQADIFVEMLVYGWFGANHREAMMLGKPVISFIRPQWLASVELELPQYAADLPIVQANPETAKDVLRDLILHPEKRAEVGRRSREFMTRWHSPEYGAHVYDDVYRRLLGGEQILRAAESDFTPLDPSLHPRLNRP